MSFNNDAAFSQEIQSRLDNGDYWANIFNKIVDLRYGFVMVFIRGKGWNYIDTNGEYLSPNQWFDLADNFEDGYAQVKINGKWGKIDTEGNITIDESKQRSAVRITESQLKGMIKQTIREVLNRR